jgi:hypothetical protein
MIENQCAFKLVKENDISNLDRNLDGLVGALAEVCQRIFSHAAGASCRSAVVSSFSPESSTKRIEGEALRETPAFPFRERTALNKVNLFRELLDLLMTVTGRRMGATFDCSSAV